jgi:hypothetical protein
MEPRVTSDLLVSALRRRAESQGGFAAVLARGDSVAGAVMVILAEKGRKARLLERVLDLNSAHNAYKWHDVPTQALKNEEEFTLFLARRRKNDPDLWLIELDVPSAERFTAEMNDSV